jgi:hypothetical protein
MPTDFFGYNRDVKANGTLVSSEFATITIGSGKQITVVQQVQAQYQQMVSPKFESGSPTLYWLTGQPQGTISFSRLIASDGFLTQLAGLKNACGSLIGVTLGLDGVGGCTAAIKSGSGTKARFTGGVPESLQISWSAGTLEVQEGASIRVATLQDA